MVELNGICFRYGGRIFELRDAGIDIEMKKEKRVSYYRLVTPKTNIDFDNVRLKPVPVETQMRLL